MDKRCGTCGHWNPGKVTNVGTLTVRSQDPTCKMTGKIRYAEHELGCFIWIKASKEALASRVKAGLIEEGECE